MQSFFLHRRTQWLTLYTACRLSFVNLLHNRINLVRGSFRQRPSPLNFAINFNAQFENSDYSVILFDPLKRIILQSNANLFLFTTRCIGENVSGDEHGRTERRAGLVVVVAIAFEGEAASRVIAALDVVGELYASSISRRISFLRGKLQVSKLLPSFKGS